MIDVALTPSALRTTSTVVVIDALRATSTIAQALAAGYRRVLCCADQARALELRGPGRVLAGEEGCVRPAGFDLGNSPRDMTIARGQELVLVTTNGTRAIVQAAALADEVVLAALVNLAAATAGLPRDVLIVCAGAEGRPSIEDTYVAGRLARGWPGRDRTPRCWPRPRLRRARRPCTPSPPARRPGAWCRRGSRATSPGARGRACSTSPRARRCSRTASPSPPSARPPGAARRNAKGAAQTHRETYMI